MNKNEQKALDFFGARVQYASGTKSETQTSISKTFVEKGVYSCILALFQPSKEKVTVQQEKQTGDPCLFRLKTLDVSLSAAEPNLKAQST